MVAEHSVNESVHVIVRVRPEDAVPGTGRQENSPKICVFAENNERISVLPIKDNGRKESHHSQPSSSTMSFSLEMTSKAQSMATRSFSFDRVFGPYSTQHDVYESAKPLIQSVISGYNATIFAYGCTGSGKTYTMTGSSESPGIVPRAVSEIFTMIRHATQAAAGEQETMFLVWLTYVELYNNKFRNLLEGMVQRKTSASSQHHQRSNSSMPSPASSVASSVGSFRGANKAEKIEVRESKEAGVFLSGPPHLRVAVMSAEEAMELIAAGDRNRSTASTACNSQSSRSHAILTFHIESRVSLGAHSEIRLGKLNLVDLAGSERVSLSGAEGGTLVETQNINLSLSSLSNVLSALSRNALQQSGGGGGLDDHSISGFSASSPSTSSSISTAAAGGAPAGPVPYRDSKLTFLLKDSLGGNSKTMMITTLRATEEYQKQSLMSLLYAARAKNIKNQTMINLDVVGYSNLNKVSSEIEQLKHRLRDRAAEFDRLCRQEKDGEGGDDSRGARKVLLRKLEELGQANAREKKELEEKLSKIILNQAGQLSTQRQEFSCLQHRLQDELARYRYTCQLQQEEITSLRGTLEALRSGASEEEVAEMRKVLEAWQTQAVATQKELVKASDQLRLLHGERAKEKEQVDELRQELEQTRTEARAMSLELSSLRTMAKDEREKASLLSQAQEELGFMRSRLEEVQRTVAEKEEMMEEMRNRDVLAESRELVSLRENLRASEAERSGMSETARQAEAERDEAIRVTRVMLEAADLGHRNCDDIERDIMEAKVAIGKQEARLAGLRDDSRALEREVQDAYERNAKLRQEVEKTVAEATELRRTGSKARSDISEMIHLQEMTQQAEVFKNQLQESEKQLVKSRLAYKALEHKFCSSVSDLEARFHVVIQEKDKRLHMAETLRLQAENSYSRLQVKLSTFESQLEKAREEAETLLRQGEGAADAWKSKAEELGKDLRNSEADLRTAKQGLRQAFEQVETERGEVTRLQEKAKIDIQELSKKAEEQVLDHAHVAERAEARVAEMRLSQERLITDAVKRAEDKFMEEKKALEGVIKTKSAEVEDATNLAKRHLTQVLQRAKERAEKLAETRSKEAVAAVEAKAKVDLDRAYKQIEALKATGSKEVATLREELSRSMLQCQALEDDIAHLRAIHANTQSQAKEGDARVKQLEEELTKVTERWGERLRSREKQLGEELALARMGWEEERQRLGKEREDAVSWVREEELQRLGKEREQAVVQAKSEATAAYERSLAAAVRDGEAKENLIVQQLEAVRHEAEAWRVKHDSLLQQLKEEQEKVEEECLRVKEEAKWEGVDRENKVLAKVAELELSLGLQGQGQDPWERLKDGLMHRLDELKGEMRQAEEASRVRAVQEGEWDSRLRSIESTWIEKVKAQTEQAERKMEEAWKARLEKVAMETQEGARMLAEEAEVRLLAAEEAYRNELAQALKQQAEALREEKERALMEKERAVVDRIKQAEEAVRGQEKVILRQGKAELAERARQIDQLRAKDEAERKQNLEAMERKEAHFKDFLEKMRRESDEALRQAVLAKDQEWFERWDRSLKEKGAEIEVIREEEAKRVGDSWQAKAAEMLAEKERYYSRKMEEVREEAQRQVEMMKVEGDMELIRIREEAKRLMEEGLEVRQREMEEERSKAVEQMRLQMTEEGRAEIERREGEFRRIVDEVGGELERAARALDDARIGAEVKALAAAAAAREEVMVRAKEREKMVTNRMALEMQEVEKGWKVRLEEVREKLRAAEQQVRLADGGTEEEARRRLDYHQREMQMEAKWAERLQTARADLDIVRQDGRLYAEKVKAETESKCKVEMEKVIREREVQIKAQFEARMHEAIQAAYLKAEAEARSGRHTRIRFWRSSSAQQQKMEAGHHHQSDWMAQALEGAGEDSFDHAADVPSNKASGSNDWVASLSQRHRLLALRLRRHKLEKGLLCLSATIERKGLALVRRGFTRWRENADKRLVDMRALAKAGRQMQHQLSTLEADRRLLLVNMMNLRQTVVEGVRSCQEALGNTSAIVRHLPCPPFSSSSFSSAAARSSLVHLPCPSSSSLSSAAITAARADAPFLPPPCPSCTSAGADAAAAHPRSSCPSSSSSLSSAAARADAAAARSSLVHLPCPSSSSLSCGAARAAATTTIAAAAGAAARLSPRVEEADMEDRGRSIVVSQEEEEKPQEQQQIEDLLEEEGEDVLMVTEEEEEGNEEDAATSIEEQMRSALLEGSAKRFKQLYSKSRKKTPLPPPSSLPPPASSSSAVPPLLLPWHDALRGHAFHGSVSRLLETLDALLAGRVSHSQVDQQGDNPLHMVFRLGAASALAPVLDRLLSVNPPITAVGNKYGQTPIHLAITRAIVSSSSAGGASSGGSAGLLALQRLLQQPQIKVEIPQASPSYLSTALEVGEKALTMRRETGRKGGRRRRAIGGRAVIDDGTSSISLVLLEVLSMLLEAGATWDRSCDEKQEFLVTMEKGLKDEKAKVVYEKIIGSAHAAGWSAGPLLCGLSN